jgi:lysine-ketoglutarate reductase/saccharopine dehydrogenase-like protein (TIGR00300 family)
MAESTRIRVEGHLIDSGLLRRIMDHIIVAGARYEFEDFEIGRTNDDPSRAVLGVEAPDRRRLDQLMANLLPLGVVRHDHEEVRSSPAPRDGIVADEFYSTTNHRTEVRHRGAWIPVDPQRMDAVIVIEGSRARCVKLRDVRSGDAVVVGSGGIRVHPPAQERDRAHFGFMSSEISSEKHVEHVVRRLAVDMHQAQADGRKVVVVAGPVVVHTGGVGSMERLLAAGAIDVVLAGNALAVHDIERALFNTSLGVDADSGESVVDGHRNHMRAINAVRRAGGIRPAVESGLLIRGIMHRSVVENVPFVLAGSLRDDGPLSEVITDMNLAQDAYAEALRGAGVVVILSSMLHGIATGNMLPSSVMTVCVDINPAAVTKLADRGSAQTVGVVTDVGLFLSLLADRVDERRSTE